MDHDQHRLASGWMSKGLSRVHADSSLTQCYELMQEKRIRHLPVVDVAGNVLGILSDRDLQRALKRASTRMGPDEGCYEFEEGATAQEYMSWPVQTVDDSTPLQEVARLMLKQKISALLVRNTEGGYIDGILTTDDLLKALVAVLSKAQGGESLTLKGWSDWQASKIDRFLI
jgi:CBS domain-containing protein